MLLSDIVLVKWKVKECLRCSNSGHLRDDSTKGYEDTQDTLVADVTSASHPAKRDNRASLKMSHNGTRGRAGCCNDEELRHIEEGGKKTALCDILMSVITSLG